MPEPTIPLQSIHRALDIIEAIADAHEGIGVTALSRQLGLKTGTTGNILKVLRERGYVDQIGDSARYTLGPRPSTLSYWGFRHSNLGLASTIPLRSLHHATGETVFLAVRRHTMLINTIVLDGTHDISIRATEQPEGRLHCTAMGKVFIAYLDEPKLSALLDATGLPQLTEATITDRRLLMQELRAVKEQGYARNRGEDARGVYGIAAPVFSAHGDVVAGVCVGYTAERWQAAYEEDLIRRVIACAAAISAGLGYVAPA
jgi:DNA-binding IclR family transcriptional regulator